MLGRPPLSVVLFFVLLAGFSLVLPMFAGPYALKFATRLAILATFVLSLDLLIGLTGLVSFGHAAFFGIGAYAVYFVSPEAEAANILVALGAGVALAAAAALVIGAFAMLTRGFYFIMVTLAAGQMLFSLFHDTDIAKGSDGAYVNVKPMVTFGDTVLLDFAEKQHFYYVCIGVLALVYGLLFAVARSSFGRALQGIRVNETRMSALGANTYRLKLTAFVLAGGLAGLAGALFAAMDGFIPPELLGWHQSGLAIMMVVLGGTGTLFGPILGALAYSALEEVLKSASLVGPFVASHWRLGTGFSLVLAVLLSPEGLAGFFPRGRPKAEVVDEKPARVDAPAPHPPRTLQTQDLSRSFGGLAAVTDVSLAFPPNLVHAIIGPNGAGKTTLTNLLSGMVRPSSGKILLDGQDVTGWPAYRMARRGLGRSFQRTTIFGRFTVDDNCALAVEARPGKRPDIIRTRSIVAEALALAGLSSRAGRIAAQLSNGEQRQLEIAMLIAGGADILLLDEPLAGMGPEETARVVALLRTLSKTHTVILVEHDMDAVFAVADRLIVLVNGRLLAQGRPDDIRHDAAVIEAYLGRAAVDAVT